MKYIIIAGHSNDSRGDRGAFSPQWGAEGAWTAKLRDLVLKELSTNGYQAISDNHLDGESRLWVVERYCRENAGINDILIDIHLNAFTDPRAKGVESFVPLSPSALELEVAEKVNVKLAEALGTVVRGAWKTGRKGVKFENESQHRKLWISSIPCHTILIEACFLTNPQEMQVLSKETEKVAKAIASVLMEYGEKRPKQFKEKAV
jgi:N-acetylmuramoyl-L-alanine amidase